MLRGFVGSKKPGFELSDDPFDDVEFVGTEKIRDSLYEGFRYRVDQQVIIDAILSAFKAEGRPVSKERQEEIDLLKELPPLSFCAWYPLVDNHEKKRPILVSKSNDKRSLGLLLNQ